MDINSPLKLSLVAEDLEGLQTFINKNGIGELESEIAALKARLANSTTQEDRIAKLEELVSKIGQGE